MARIDRLDEETRNLVKIASVIGRSFFYRILKEMTKTTEDIDDRLSYLQEIQLFRERKRMEELEYLFKHALAQEAAYESILLQTRKELHLKVADAIEKVFKERLHEFYGMLAYHYSQGEDLDKAEEYMIKAGEEAMGSSASREALHYYQEALSLYLKKYGDTADPEKLAMFEKNIANALFNKGEFEDAMDYFDSALKRWGIKPPRNKILMLIKLLFDLLMVTLKLYFPIKKSRKMPTQRDRDIFNLSRNKCIALVSVNPMRMFVEVIGDIKRILKFDLGKIESGYDTLFSGAGIFTATALSYRLSNKFLEYGERFIDKNNLRELFELRFHRGLHNASSGQLDDIQDYDALLVDENLKVGLFWEVTYYLYVLIMSKVSRGDFNDADPLLDKLSKIFDDYEYKFSKQSRLIGELAFFIQRRGLNDAQKVFEQYDLLFKMGSGMETVSLLGFKAEVQILFNDYDGAEKTLSQAEQIYRKHGIVFPFLVQTYLRSRFSLDIRLLEGSILSNNKSNISTYRKQARKSCKRLLQNTVKSAASRSEAYGLLGQYYWIIGRLKKAVKWWKKSVEEGERLGARPDLARTYMEIGKRLLEKKSKFKELNGISAKEYLEKARAMFQEMDLQWDLDALEKVRNEVPQMPSRNH
jgi:tetratricopeptide (TPR) repeat protein